MPRATFRSRVGPNFKIPPKIAFQKFVKMTDHLCLHQFDKFCKWWAINHRKRKLCEFAETCMEKLGKSLLGNLFFGGFSTFRTNFRSSMQNLRLFPRSLLKFLRFLSFLSPLFFVRKFLSRKWRIFVQHWAKKIRIPLQFSSSPFFIQNFKRGVQCSEDQNAFAQILSYIYFLLCKYVAHFPQILKQNLFHQMIFYILQLATKIFRPSGVSVFKVYIF